MKSLSGKFRSDALGSQGFTFVELLIAVGLLMITLPVSLLAIMDMRVLNEASRNRMIAQTHAQTVLEQVKDAGFTTMKTDIDAGAWDWNSTLIESNGLDPLLAEAIDTQASGTDELNVTVQVFWEDHGGRVSAYSLETLFTNV